MVGNSELMACVLVNGQTGKLPREIDDYATNQGLLARAPLPGPYGARMFFRSETSCAGEGDANEPLVRSFRSRQSTLPR